MAGHPGAFRAWLGQKDPNVRTPTTRFTRSRVPYVRVDGVTIAESWSDLTDATLAAPLDVDGFGQTVDDGDFDPKSLLAPAA
ncbi:MAG: hypothetical protein CVU56_20205 [Deltaproteobacteria bacterium HGW-Deltaproteobacteria-14]|jgi:hypothetical protein|nr:MAG: hypothetical protein CVU56_20205 [Deltaproteobacteria bacterium HGW-Deltaproteobacteria-14]